MGHLPPPRAATASLSDSRLVSAPARIPGVCSRSSATTSGESRDLLHDAIVGRWLKRIGYALATVGFSIFYLVWFEGVLQVETRGLDFSWGFVGFGIFTLAGFFLFWGKRYVARAMSAERLQDSRAPVVFLRPFHSDPRALRMKVQTTGDGVSFFTLFEGVFDKTLEDYLAESLRSIGPLVALGQPCEALPPAGAVRFRETHHTWKDRVVDLLRSARLVVLIPGASEALFWEMWTAFQELRPQQLVILGVGKDTPREYAALSLIFKEATGQELPDRRTLGRADRSGITFDEGWTPRILRLRASHWRFLLSFLTRVRGPNLHYGLEPVFRANGIEWQPLPISMLEVRRLLAFAASLGIFVLAQWTSLFSSIGNWF
jgi:hypothetical protein